MLFLLVVAFIVLLLIATGGKSAQQSKICKMHKWTSDINGHYFCQECKKRPGEITTDYDKPY